MKQIRYLTRKDRYGQNYKCVCSCGMSSNWHIEPSRAKYALYQNHSMNGGCYEKPCPIRGK